MFDSLLSNSFWLFFGFDSFLVVFRFSMVTDCVSKMFVFLRLITPIDDKIKDGKLQYNINRQAAKISALSSL